MAVGAVSAPAGLLEREQQLRALFELLDDAGAGRGRLLAIEAAAGLGKSTLLGHAAAVAGERGMLVLRGAGRELERELGWGVARSLFESWLLGLADAARHELLAGPAAAGWPLFAAPSGGAGAGGAEAGFALLHGLYWLTVRIGEARPLLLVVDDAHWADEPSLRFLLYLVGRQGELPVAVLVAGRAGEAGAGGLWGSLLSEPAVTVLGLAPLSCAAVGALVRERVRDADEAVCARAFALTAGNPLFVRELVTAADPALVDLEDSAERAAASLARSVRRRLAARSRAAQALARAVAVLEGGVALEPARVLAGLDASAALRAADELALADILRPADALEFVHPLLRAAVYAGLGRQERAASHARAGLVLLEHGIDVEHVGGHLLQGAPAGDDRVVDALRRAAARAVAHGVPASAIAYLERALREPPTADVRAHVLAELGRAELLAGRRDAVDHLRVAVELFEDPPQRARVWLDLSRTLHDFGRVEEACQAAERGLDGIDPHSELGLDLQAGYLTAAMLVDARVDDAYRRVDAILAHDGGDRSAARISLESKAMFLRLFAGGTQAGGTRSEIAGLARRVFAGGRLIDEGGVRGLSAMHAAGCLSYCDEYDAAGAVLDAIATHARREGAVTLHAVALQVRARQRLWTGAIAEAIEDARTAFEWFVGAAQLWIPACGYCLARGLLEADEPDAAQDVLRRMTEGVTPTGMFAAWRFETAGRLAAHRGSPAAARDAFLAAGDWLAGVRVTNPAVCHWRSEAALAALGVGDRAPARALIDEELVLAERFGAPRAIGVARRAAGLLARGEDAVQLLRSAADLHAGCGARVEHARARGAHACRRARSRRPRPGRRPLAERAPCGRARGRRAHQPADRQRAVRHDQSDRVAPRQRLPQARRPRPCRAPRRARRPDRGRWHQPRRDQLTALASVTQRRCRPGTGVRAGVAP